MIDRLAGLYARALARWVDLVRAHPWVVLGICLLLAAGAGLVTVQRLGINTSNTGLIADDVPFRRHAIDYDLAFPILDQQVLAVVDAATGEAADAAAETLAEALRGRPDLFFSVYLPSGDPFFRRNGLLFLETAEVYDLSNRLAESQAFLVALAADPSLRGLFGLLQTIGEGLDRIDTPPAKLAEALDAIAAAVEDELAGRPGVLSWRSLAAGGAGGQDSPRRLVLLQLHRDLTSFSPAGEAVAEIRRLAAAAGLTPEAGVTVRLTGSPVLQQEEFETVQRGATLASVLSFVLTALLLVIGQRSARLIAAILATLVVGLVWTVGFATLAIGHLNLISAAFAVLFIGLGEDFCVHFSLRYREAVAGGAGHRAALRQTAAGTGGALTLSAVCAVIGFLAFVPTDYRGLAELGIISAAGMVLALVGSLTVLPAVLSLWPRPPAFRPGAAAAPSGLTRLLERRPGRILAATALVSVLALLAAPFARFDFNPLNLQDPENESVATYLDLARDSGTTPYRINVLAGSLAEAEAVAARLDGLDIVESAVTLARFVPEEQDAKLAAIDDMALFLAPMLTPTPPRPPPSAAERQASLRALIEALGAVPAATEDAAVRAAAARLEAALTAFDTAAGGAPEALAALERRLIGFLPRYLSDLRLAMTAGPIALDDLPESLVERWVAADGRARVEVAPAIDVSGNEAMRRFARAVLEIEPRATGTPVIVTGAEDAVVGAFVEASGLTLLGLVLVLAVVLRNPLDMALALAPFALMALWTLAASAALDLPFNFANVIVLPLLFALGVSSSIHLVMRRREAGDVARALGSSTPRAVFFAVLSTVASFGSLALSAHRGMASMGWMLTVANLFILLSTLIVLPAVMVALQRRAGRRAARRVGPEARA